MGGEGFEVPVAEADLCVGGRYRIVMRTPGGEEHDVSGTYREVVPNRCDATFAKAKQLGGKECVAPTDIPNAGRFAIVTDSTGAMIAFMKATQ